MNVRIRGGFFLFVRVDFYQWTCISCTSKWSSSYKKQPNTANNIKTKSNSRFQQVNETFSFSLSLLFLFKFLLYICLFGFSFLLHHHHQQQHLSSVFLSLVGFSFSRSLVSLSLSIYLFKPSTVSYPDKNKTKKIAKENKYWISEQNPEVCHRACVCVFLFRKGDALVGILERQKNGEMDLGVRVLCVLLVRSLVCLLTYGCLCLASCPPLHLNMWM